MMIRNLQQEEKTKTKNEDEKEKTNGISSQLNR